MPDRSFYLNSRELSNEHGDAWARPIGGEEISELDAAGAFVTCPNDYGYTFQLKRCRSVGSNLITDVERRVTFMHI